MSVRVAEKETGKVVIGKYAKMEKGQVLLYSGCMDNKKGGLRGCGKKSVFLAEQVTVAADEPSIELAGF
ncbi:MAG: hypothetical protein HW403_522 [Dehalococcoidia bacterium]|nr:hypothetical protein [Dehalococcoidia bacterium]